MGWWVSTQGAWYPPDASVLRRAQGADAASPVATVQSDRAQPTAASPVGSMITKKVRAALGDRAAVLSDRVVPDGTAPIDHLVVAPSGVWVVLVHQDPGRVELDADAGIGHERFLVGGEDRTDLIDLLYDALVPVATLLSDPSLPLHGAVALLDGEWGSSTASLGTGPYRCRGAWIVWPAALVHKIEAPGPLHRSWVRAIATRLDEALPSR
jgi:hypothetical protein